MIWKYRLRNGEIVPILSEVGVEGGMEFMPFMHVACSAPR